MGNSSELCMGLSNGVKFAYSSSLSPEIEQKVGMEAIAYTFLAQDWISTGSLYLHRVVELGVLD